MQAITEEMNVHEEWYEIAKGDTMQTPDDLKDFVVKLTTEYEHDYGTICHAVAAAGSAAGTIVDRSPAGGITGFQASCIMWEFIKQWGSFPKDNPLQLRDMGDLLYPQMEHKFTTISPSIWEWVQKKARINLVESTDNAHPNVIGHWESIDNGVIPFGLIVSNHKGE